MNKANVFLWVMICVVAACSPKIIYNEEMLVDRFEFDYLTAKAKIRFESSEQKINATVNLRMRRDSAIWLSITPGLNLEVARILILTDTIHIVDKIQKRYFAYSFAELSDTYDFDLNFGLIQSAVLGNLIYPYTKEDVIKKEDGIFFRQQKANVLVDHFIGGMTRKLENIQVTDLKTSNKFELKYSDFKPVDDEIFAHLIEARLSNIADGTKSVFLEIGYNKAQLSDKQLKFPFNVPGKYQD